MLSSIVITITLLNAVTAQYTETAAVVGDRAKLKCRSDIQGSLSVMWYNPENEILTLNEDVLSEDDRISVDHPYSQEWNLMIDNVHMTDAGNYTCQIRAGVSMDHVVNLAIHYPPTMETVSPDVSVVTGTDVSLQCTASGAPPPAINWYRHTVENERIRIASDQPELHLMNVTKETAGSYQCEADNGVPPMASAHIKVNVQFLPVLALPYHSFSQQQGRDTLLQCPVTANPLTGHYWMKDGVRIEDSEKYRIQKWSVSQYTYILGVFVMGLTEKDFGTYICVAENSFGSVNESLEMFETPHEGSVEVVHKPQDVISRPGQTIKINCTVTGETSRDNLIWWRHTMAGGYQKLFESNPVAAGLPSSQNGQNQNEDSDPPARREASYTQGARPGSSRPLGPVLTSGGIVGLKDGVEDVRRRLLEDRVEVQGHYNLMLRGVVEEDGGKYGCELVGRQNYTAELTVVENVTCESNDTSIVQGEMLNISCSLRYHGHHSNWVVSWQHEDRQMSSIHHDAPGLLKRVVSFRAWDTDSGRYTCEVESGDRKQLRDSCEMVMEVREPPPEMKPPPQPTGAPSTGLQTNLSMTGIVLGGALVAITLVFVVILGCTVKYYRNELSKYKSGSPSRYGNGATSVEMEALRMTHSQDSGNSLPEEV